MSEVCCLIQVLALECATVLQMTPSMLSYVSERVAGDTLLTADSRLRWLLLGGETFPPMAALRRAQQPGQAHYHEYV